MPAAHNIFSASYVCSATCPSDRYSVTLMHIIILLCVLNVVGIHDGIVYVSVDIIMLYVVDIVSADRESPSTTAPTVTPIPTSIDIISQRPGEISMYG